MSIIYCENCQRRIDTDFDLHDDCGNNRGGTGAITSNNSAEYSPESQVDGGSTNTVSLDLDILKQSNKIATDLLQQEAEDLQNLLVSVSEIYGIILQQNTNLMRRGHK